MITDYANRRVDALALRDTGGGFVTQSFFDSESSGEICTGIIKLSQRWLLEFMTARGSMPFLPERGADFIRAARQGRLRTEADVNVEFRFAVEDVRQNLVAEESDDMPADERYASASLDQLLLTENGELAITVTVTSIAGDARTIVVPVAVSTLSSPFGE
jgi:hypothetical protein